MSDPNGAQERSAGEFWRSSIRFNFNALRFLRAVGTWGVSQAHVPNRVKKVRSRCGRFLESNCPIGSSAILPFVFELKGSSADDSKVRSHLLFVTNLPCTHGRKVRCRSPIVRQYKIKPVQAFNLYCRGGQANRFLNQRPNATH